MHVIGHQAKRVHRAAKVSRQLPQVREINEEIRVVSEAIYPVVPALNDVYSHIG